MRDLVLLLLLFGCGETRGSPLPPAQELELPWDGLSGLARRPSGTLWAVPERQRVLIPLEEGATVRRGGEAIPIAGVPDGMDTEALAWISEDLAALGSETWEDDRPKDDVLLVRVAPNSAVVEELVALPYSLWGRTGADNRGATATIRLSGSHH